MYCFNDIIKGDSIVLEITIRDDEGDLVNITGWKIRVELYDDNGSCLRYATVNTGGTLGDVTITDAINGVFCIQIPKDATKCFCDKGWLESEVETSDIPSKKFTILTRNNAELNFVDSAICWDTP